MSPSPKKRRSKRGQRLEVREKIIEAAFFCLGERGYQSTTLLDIAERVGCSRELPRYYFGSKEGMVSALIEESQNFWMSVFSDQAQAGAVGIDAFSRMVDSVERHVVEQPARARGLVTLAFGAADPANSKLRAKIVAAQRLVKNHMRIMIEDELEKQRRQGAVESDPTRETQGLYDDLELDTLASLMYSTLRGVTYCWITAPEEISLRAMLEGYKSTTALSIGQLYARRRQVKCE